MNVNEDKRSICHRTEFTYRCRFLIKKLSFKYTG